MKNKILAICLAVLMLLSVPVMAQNEYEREMGVLIDMGILSSEKMEEEPVTRGDFTAAVVCLLGIENHSGENVFSDVQENAGYINTAASLGIIKGFGDGTFRPGDAIKFEQAVKILVCATGYEILTDYNFPAGYMSVAAQKGLLKGVSDTDTFTWHTAAKLLFNAAHTDLFQSDLNGGYKAVEGENAITKYHGAKILEGTIEADDTAFVKGTLKAPDNSVIISGEVLYDPQDKAAMLLGHKVKVYYKDETIISVFDKSGEESITLLHSDIIPEKTTLTSFAYFDGEKDKFQNIESNAAFIYNGKNETPSLTLLPKYGKAELIDTDGDGKSEIVKIYDSRVEIVEAVNAGQRIITFKDAKGRIELPVDAVIMGYKGSIDISAIKSGDVITISQSLDGKLITVEVSSTKIKGTVLEKGEKSIALDDGKTYEVLDTALMEEITVGNVVNIYLDTNGFVAGTAISKMRGVNYGYLIDAKYEKNINGYEGMIRVFEAASGAIKNYKINGDKITVNDSRINRYRIEYNGKRAIDEFMSGGKVVNQLVKYVTDANGEIYKIYKAKTNTAEPFVATDDFSLDIDYPNSTNGGVNTSYVIYDSGGNAINNMVGLANAICIMVPKLQSGETLAEREGEISIFSPQTLWVDPKHRLENFKAYDMDEDCMAKIIIQEGSVISGGRSYADSYIYVDKVADVLDEDGEIVKKIYGFMDGKEVAYTFSKTNTYNLSDDDMKLYKGDVIRVQTDNSGICDVIKIFSLKEKSGYLMHKDAKNNFVMPLSAEKYSKLSQCNWYERGVALHCTVGRISKQNLYVDINDDIKGRFLPMVSPQIMVYDEARDELRTGNIADVDPYDDSQSVLLRIRYSSCYEIYVIDRVNSVSLPWEGGY